MRESKKYKSEGNMKAANSAKASAYGIAAQEATKMVSEIIDITMKVISKNIERKQIEMKAGAEKVNATFDLWSKGIQKSMDIAIGGFGSSIQENSAKAGQAALEIGKTYLTTQIQLKAIEYNKAADLAINSAEMTKELVTGIGTKIGDTLSSIPNPYTAIIGGVVSIGSAIFGATEDYKIMQEKY